MNEAGEVGNGLPFQMIGIPGAVPPFVVMADRSRDLIEAGPLEDLSPPRPGVFGIEFAPPSLGVPPP